MSFYPPKINEKFCAPENAGRLDSANAVATRATLVCGAVLRFYLLIDTDSKIVAAKFQTDGCGFLIAAAETLAEKIINRKLSELHGLDESLTRRQIEDVLGEFPPEKKHCLNLTLTTLQAVFNDFRRVQLQEWVGEKALICTCFGVSEERIEKLVTENSLQSVEEVTEMCNAGGGCGSCQPLIQEIIDAQSFDGFFDQN